MSSLLADSPTVQQTRPADQLTCQKIAGTSRNG